MELTTISLYQSAKAANIGRSSSLRSSTNRCATRSKLLGGSCVDYARNTQGCHPDQRGGILLFSKYL